MEQAYDLSRDGFKISFTPDPTVTPFLTPATGTPTYFLDVQSTRECLTRCINDARCQIWQYTNSVNVDESCRYWDSEFWFSKIDKKMDLTFPIEKMLKSDEDSTMGERECILRAEQCHQNVRYVTSGSSLAGQEITESSYACALLCASTKDCGFWKWNHIGNNGPEVNGVRSWEEKNCVMFKGHATSLNMKADRCDSGVKFCAHPEAHESKPAGGYLSYYQERLEVCSNKQYRKQVATDPLWEGGQKRILGLKPRSKSHILGGVLTLGSPIHTLFAGQFASDAINAKGMQRSIVTLGLQQRTTLMDELMDMTFEIDGKKNSNHVLGKILAYDGHYIQNYRRSSGSPNVQSVQVWHVNRFTDKTVGYQANVNRGYDELGFMSRAWQRKENTTDTTLRKENTTETTTMVLSCKWADRGEDENTNEGDTSGLSDQLQYKYKKMMYVDDDLVTDDAYIKTGIITGEELSGTDNSMANFHSAFVGAKHWKDCKHGADGYHYQNARLHLVLRSVVGSTFGRDASAGDVCKNAGDVWEVSPLEILAHSKCPTLEFKKVLERGSIVARSALSPTEVQFLALNLQESTHAALAKPHRGYDGRGMDQSTCGRNHSFCGACPISKELTKTCLCGKVECESGHECNAGGLCMPKKYYCGEQRIACDASEVCMADGPKELLKVKNNETTDVCKPNDKLIKKKKDLYWCKYNEFGVTLTRTCRCGKEGVGCEVGNVCNKDGSNKDGICGAVTDCLYDYSYMEFKEEEGRVCSQYPPTGGNWAVMKREEAKGFEADKLESVRKDCKWWDYTGRMEWETLTSPHDCNEKCASTEFCDYWNFDGKICYMLDMKKVSSYIRKTGVVFALEETPGYWSGKKILYTSSLVMRSRLTRMAPKTHFYARS